MDIQIPTQEGDISVPLSSSGSYAQAAAVSHILHLHVPDIHNHHLISSTAPPLLQTNNNGGGASGSGPIVNDHDHHDSPHHHMMGAASTFKKVGVVVKYRECLKNHAAAMGGNAIDGCGEFMPSGEEGSIEALTCSACNCHRNFHRKEVEGDHHLQPCDWAAYGHSPQHLNRLGRKVILGGGHQHKNMLPHEALVYPTGALVTSRAAIPHQMIMPYNMSAGSDSDEQDDMVRPSSHLPMVKKRFRTKFTQEQKDKMLHFAEKVGWKIQRQEESVVQNFCQEIGVKRRVLKVWMHNNKHNLAKKTLNNSNNDREMMEKER